MTDLTDQATRDMLEWARIAVASKGNQEHEPWVTAARYILATVEAPAPTLAEELARIAENSPVWTVRNVRDELESAAARAKQMEHDLVEARAEVERLTAECEDAHAKVEWLTAEDKRKDKAAAEGVEILLRKNGYLTNTIAHLVTTSNIINNGGRITYTEKDGKPVQESDTTTWKADE